MESIMPKDIKIKQPTKELIKENYEKLIRNNKDKIYGVERFSYLFGYPDSKTAVLDAAQISREVWRYYEAHKNFDIFLLGHLCTAVFFQCRAWNHQGYYPKEASAERIAICNEIIKRIVQLLH